MTRDEMIKELVEAKRHLDKAMDYWDAKPISGASHDVDEENYITRAWSALTLACKEVIR